jgi:hypothetical protein
VKPVWQAPLVAVVVGVKEGDTVAVTVALRLREADDVPEGERLSEPVADGERLTEAVAVGERLGVAGMDGLGLGEGSPATTMQHAYPIVSIGLSFNKPLERIST